MEGVAILRMRPESGEEARRMPKTAARRMAPPAAAEATVARVPFDAPWAWLAAGWRDMWAVPHVSLAYGALFAIVSALLPRVCSLAAWSRSSWRSAAASC